MEGWNPLIAQLTAIFPSPSHYQFFPPSSSRQFFLLGLSHYRSVFVSFMFSFSSSSLLRLDPYLGRIVELFSNRHKLVWNNHNGFEEDKDKNSKWIRVGAEALVAIPEREPRGVVSKEDVVVAQRAVLMNAVEVQDQEGRALEITIFGPTFSWINHSCSTRACYRFSLSSPSSSASNSSEESKLRIAPFACSSCETEIDNGVCSNSSEFAKEEGEQGYGPRLIVRSIKRIKKGKEVTVTYTDLF